MAKTEQNVAQILESVKKNKTEISRNKAASVKLLESTKKINKNVAALYEKSKEKVNSTFSEFKSTLDSHAVDAKAGMRIEQKAVEQIKKDANKEYARFKKDYTAATSGKDGVGARHRKIVDLHKNAQRLHGEISKSATSSKNTGMQIQELHKNATENESQISEINSRAGVLSKEIEDTYSIVVDTTLAGTLVTRREDLKNSVKVWEWVYIISLGLISAAVILALVVNRPTDLIAIVTERLVFITPLVVVAFVASRQFTHERRLLEEYAFKAATAQSLKGYTLLLNEQFKDMPDSRKEILAFTIGAMKNIYDRQPLENKSSKYHFVAGSKLARIEARIEEVQQQVQNDKKTPKK